MGHRLTQHELGAIRAHRLLRGHPNFRPPPAPGRGDVALLTYAVEAAAAFVSPPKVDGENEEFACEDVAEALRKHLLPELIRTVRLARGWSE